MHGKSAIRPFVIAFAFLLFFLSMSGILFVLPIALNGKTDFRQLYTAGYMARTGHGAQLYDYDQTEAFQNQVVSPADEALPFNHLAYESLVYAPLSFLKYRTAYVVFFGVNLAVLVAAFWMLRKYLLPLVEVWTLLPIAIFACFLPITFALLQGQDAILLLALMICAYILVERGEEFRGGILLGLTLFKFQYALPIVLLFMVWRRWRFFCGFAVSAVAAVSVSLWITGWGGFLSYEHSLLEMSARFSSVFAHRYGIHPQFMPNVRGLAYMIAGGSSLETHAIVVILSVVVLAWTAMQRPSFPLALLAALLVSYHQLISDMSLMVLPLALALSGAFVGASANTVRTIAIGSAIFCGPAVLLLAGDRFYLLALPLMALLVVWDGQRPPITASLNQPIQRRGVSTNGNAFWTDGTRSGAGRCA